MAFQPANVTYIHNGKLKLRLHALQFQVFNCPARFRVVAAGRRFGKTELAIVEIVKTAVDVPNSKVLYVCPTERQAKYIVWNRLKQLTQELWAKKPSETDHCIYLKNGSVIYVKGAFDPNSLRGVGLDFVVLDEVADLKPDAWSHVLRPALADRQGRALFIGTPKGRDLLYDYSELAKTNTDWAAFHFTTEQGGIVTKAELDAVGREMDLNVYRREFEAKFNLLGDYRVYLGFDYTANVREVRFEISLPIIWSLDFNVDPMCMLVMQKSGENVHVLEEIVVRSKAITTEDACKLFMERMESYVKAVSRVHGAMEVRAYGDSSGNQRRTSAAATDWTIIRSYFQNFHKGVIELSCREVKMNPQVRDRINCVNARLRNAHGDPTLFIHPTCKELIRDLEENCYTVDSTNSPTREINKSDPARTHMADALGYYLSQVFPLKGFFSL